MRHARLIVSATLLLIGTGSLGAQPCWDSVFLAREDFENRSAGASFTMVVRVYEDCPVERQVFLERDDSGEILATITQPERQSIDTQLESLRQQYRGKSDTELCDLLQMKSWTVSSKKKPRLKGLIDTLLDLEVPVAFEPEIVIHGVRYSVWISRLHNRSYYEFQGPPFRRSARSGTLHPLDRWSQELLGTLGISCELEKF